VPPPWWWTSFQCAHFGMPMRWRASLPSKLSSTRSIGVALDAHPAEV
jgi:hypothetical protein